MAWVRVHDSVGQARRESIILATCNYGLVLQEARLSTRGRRYYACTAGDVVARLTWSVTCTSFLVLALVKPTCTCKSSCMPELHVPTSTYKYALL